MSKVEKACQALGCAANELVDHNPKAAIAIAQTMVSLMRGELDAVTAKGRTRSPSPQPNKRREAAPPTRAPKPANRRKQDEAPKRAPKPANRRKPAPPQWAIQLASSLTRLGIPVGAS